MMAQYRADSRSSNPSMDFQNRSQNSSANINMNRSYRSNNNSDRNHTPHNFNRHYNNRYDQSPKNLSDTSNLPFQNQRTNFTPGAIPTKNHFTPSPLGGTYVGLGMQDVIQHSD